VKLLVLHSELGVLQGGGETFTRNLFTEFAERGHNITAAFVADRHGAYPFALPPCIEPVPLPGRWSRKLGQGALSAVGRRIPPGSAFRSEWNRMQEALCWRSIRWHNRRFQRRVEREFAGQWKSFDAVYVQSNVELASSVASHQRTVLMLPGPVDAALAPALCKLHAACAHDDGLAHLRAFLGDRAREIPLGLDTGLFSPGATAVRTSLGWSDRHVVMGYVGRLTRLKGIDLLVSALQRVLRTLPDVRILFVGSGEEEPNVRSSLEREIARGVVHMEPAMDQKRLPDWYRAIDLIVMPSRYETMSNSVLEAMACSVPFLASDVGGNKTLGQTGAGWLFKSESVSALGGCLHSIASDRGDIKVRGAIGRRYVAQRHSWARSAECLERIIDNTGL
jgi:glycosyltransferase involved in cell wall biosynthesis